MLEAFIARVKITFFLALFLAPIAVSAWSKSLDRWLETNQRFEALPEVSQPVPFPGDVIALVNTD